MKWENKLSSDSWLSQQTFCLKLSKLADLCRCYSVPNQVRTPLGLLQFVLDVLQTFWSQLLSARLVVANLLYAFDLLSNLYKKSTTNRSSGIRGWLGTLLLRLTSTDFNNFRQKFCRQSLLSDDSLFSHVLVAYRLNSTTQARPDPHGPARTLSETRTDPTELRPGPQKKVRAGPCGPV